MKALALTPLLGVHQLTWNFLTHCNLQHFHIFCAFSLFGIPQGELEPTFFFIDRAHEIVFLNASFPDDWIHFSKTELSNSFCRYANVSHWFVISAKCKASRFCSFEVFIRWSYPINNFTIFT